MTQGHVSDRLEALRQYRAQLSSCAFNCDKSNLRESATEPQQSQPVQHFVNGSITTTTTGLEPEVIVYTPSSTTRGLPAQRWSIPVGDLISDGEVYGAGADVSQDLLVVYHHARSSSCV